MINSGNIELVKTLNSKHLNEDLKQPLEKLLEIDNTTSKTNSLSSGESNE